MSDNDTSLTSWVGRSETVHDTLDPTPVIALIATPSWAVILQSPPSAFTPKRQHPRWLAGLFRADYLGQSDVMVDRVLASLR